MSRLVVVLPLTALRTGDSFPVSEWPLHITVLPPFHTDAAASVIAGVVAGVVVGVTGGVDAVSAGGRTAITAVAGVEALFGRREDVPVTLVVDDAALTELHRALVDAVRPFASSPDEPAFTGPGFRAHITIKNGARVHEGEVLTLAQIALVDMAPRAAAGGRSVLAVFPLAAPAATALGPGNGVSGSAQALADHEDGEEQGGRYRHGEGDDVQHRALPPQPDAEQVHDGRGIDQHGSDRGHHPGVGDRVGLAEERRDQRQHQPGRQSEG
ncbi:hypothetical protein E3T24_16865 [Cryobacterium sp. TmT2-59]|uniref:2'-5' RNA ligase family protein n=1 Tax=Cryobacterium shii TaxID=1259235 RepID=A0AAQ2HGF3_9MICO|nr:MULTISPECIES: 2'-5' RNA ligase family protein [Cryobacterium]TFC51220.1 hypothetical protein E3O49_03850 [Cryobacterium shii]TFC80476.1 hypothetical protein E3T24_16865 [Cryobacterium sp. TmT2-59]TFD17512.1 hypothetical protein E3T42_07660 [Cryobacterium sp. TMT4-10]